MENSRMIYEIQSKYILKNIFNYIQNKLFELKLFSTSKLFQTRLNISYSYCYIKYLNGIDFNLKEYLYQDEDHYEKDELKKEYNYFILKNTLNKKKFENIL